MKLHELKILDKYYTEVLVGNKTFELRKDDRDYQVGDLLTFNVVDENGNIMLRSTEVYRITYKLTDVEKYGLAKEFCILGIKKMEERA